MKVCPVFSSSKGNMYLVSYQGQYLMLDAGRAGKVMLEHCLKLVEDPAQIRGIVLTHAHTDHMGGLRVFLNYYKKRMGDSRKEDLCFYCHPKTFVTVEGKEKTIAKQYRELKEPKTLGAFTVTPFYLPHDEYCQGYVVQAGDATMAIAIDFGHQDEHLLNHLKGVELLLLEANYHPTLLAINEKYIPSIKERIKSPAGHLSNEESVKIVKDLMGDTLKTVVFCHLSSDNNEPKHVLEALEKECGENRPAVVDFANREGAKCWYDVKTGEQTAL